jgi:hypothetical protein
MLIYQISKKEFISALYEFRSIASSSQMTALMRSMADFGSNSLFDHS